MITLPKGWRSGGENFAGTNPFARKTRPIPWYEVIPDRKAAIVRIRRMFSEHRFSLVGKKIKRVQLGPLKLDVPPGKVRPADRGARWHN